jgi:hypothetical protein
MADNLTGFSKCGTQEIRNFFGEKTKSPREERWVKISSKRLQVRFLTS